MAPPAWVGSSCSQHLSVMFDAAVLLAGELGCRLLLVHDPDPCNSVAGRLGKQSLTGNLEI